MSTSSPTHGLGRHGGGRTLVSRGTAHLAPSTSFGWFAIAVAATFTAAVLGALTWSQLGVTWTVGSLVAIVAVAGTALASRHGRDAAVAFLAGSVVTVAGLYAALLAMAQFYAVAVQN